MFRFQRGEATKKEQPSHEHYIAIAYIVLLVSVVTLSEE